MKDKLIPVARPSLEGNELDYLKNCIETSWISSQGEYVEKFEKKFSSYIGKNHGISTANGTVALHLALRALDISEGDEVIVPDFTFAASVNSIIYTGATPRLVDVNRDSWTIDPKKIEEKITENTKAIMPVHIYGQPCNMDIIVEIAKEHELHIIEDCAEALGAKYKGKKMGNFGDISCFSFYGNKVLTTGEGGMCITDNEDLKERMEMLRDHGMNQENRYWHEEVGFNYRMTNLQGAIGVAQLERLNDFLNKRKQIQNKYDNKLKNIDGIELQNNIKNRKKVCWMYSILINENKFGLSRDKLIEKIEQNNIGHREFFYAIHEMPLYQKFVDENEKYPISKELSRKGINLPTFTSLSEKQINRICKIIENSHI